MIIIETMRIMMYKNLQVNLMGKYKNLLLKKGAKSAGGWNGHKTLGTRHWGRRDFVQ